MFRYPDFRIVLLAAAFPFPPGVKTGVGGKSGQNFAAFVPGNRGGAVLDLHQLPYSDFTTQIT